MEEVQLETLIPQSFVQELHVFVIDTFFDKYLW